MTVKPKLKHAQIIRMGRLLNMLYKPTEIALELETTADTIVRTWMPAGLPFTSDARGHKWINGKECAEWINSQRTRVPNNVNAGMKENEAYCVKCRGVVPFLNPIAKPINRHAEILKSTCPKCGSGINRIRGSKKSLKKGSKR